MARLPVLGGDEGNWGQILNDFLAVEFIVDDPDPAKIGTLRRTDIILAKYGKPPSGIPFSDLSSLAPPSDPNNDGVQWILNLAKTAVQPDDPALTASGLNVKQANVLKGNRHAINLIEGAGISMTVADNGGANQVDVTINSVAGAGGTFTIQKDGATTNQRATLDFVGGPLVVDDNVGNRTRVHIQREYLNVTDPRVGVVMGDSSNQGAKLQTALNLAGATQADSTVFIPPGKVISHQQLNMPNRSNRLLGAGGGKGLSDAISVIHFPNDVGAGTYGLHLANGGYQYTVEKLMLAGPGANSGHATPVGDFPHDSNDIQTQMYGMSCFQRCVINDVRILGFAGGIGVLNDHQEWHSVDLRGNGYGMDWMDNAVGGLGDHYMDRCNFSNQSRAGIAVADNNTIANARLIACQFGDSPYAIKRYTTGSGARSTFLVGVTFDNCSFVNCANGIIFDEPGLSNVQGNIGIIFDAMMESGTFTGPAWGARRPAAIDVYSAGVHFRGCAMPLFAGKYSVAASFITVIDDYFDFETMDSLGTKPFFASTVNANHTVAGCQLGLGVRGAGGVGDSLVVVNQTNASGVGGSVLVANETIAKGDLLEMVSYTSVQRCRFNGFSQIVGVAGHSANSGEACVFLTQANTPSLLIHNKTDNNTSPLSPASIPDGSLLKPDPNNPGGVVPAADPAHGPIIGRVVNGAYVNGVYVPQAIAPGASGRAQIII
jgi:hypothetical protein